jgi:hypothetical protein
VVRIEPLERSLPNDWRRAIRDHPLLSMAGAAIVGVYIGRNHGRQLLAALVSSGIAFGVESVRGAIGFPPRQTER